MSKISDIELEAQRLLKEAQRRKILLRLLGGLAIKWHSPHANHSILQRQYPDIDFAVDWNSAPKLPLFFADMGYLPNKAFNTLNGDRRLLFQGGRYGYRIDIFVGEFDMCHKIPLDERLGIDQDTIPLAELFLTKAQIVELNHKDAVDLIAMLLDHSTGSGDKEMINVDRIARLCAADWGLFTTVSRTCHKLTSMLSNGNINLNLEERKVVTERLSALQLAMAQVPKSLSWKLRAKIGTRMRWYQEVEEIYR